MIIFQFRYLFDYCFQMTRKYYSQDPEHPEFTIVRYTRTRTKAELEERNERRLQLQAMEEEIYADPVTAYLYEKQKEDLCTVRRLSKRAEFSTYSHKDLLDYVKRSSNNDGMPVVIRRVKPGSEEFSPHKALKEIKSSYRASARERRIERNADEGKFTELRRFSEDFIDEVKRTRVYRNLTQRELGALINVSESDIRLFEAGELMYNGELRAKLLWKLGM